MGQTTSSLPGGSFIYDDEYDNYHKNEERRIILIGKTGTGKSTLGNAILGKQTFKNECVQMQANTIHCQMGCCRTKEGKDIVVLDTPGLMNTKREPAKVFEELCKCTAMMAPGPHAFCLVIRGDDRFTQENVDTLEEFCAFFGEEIYKHLVVVFTHKASMGKNVTTVDCLKSLPVQFQEKFSKFGGRKIAIECKVEKTVLKQQIKELHAFIEEIIKQNNGGYYAEEKFKAAEEAFRKRIPKLQQLLEKKFEAKKHLLQDKYQKKEKRIEDGEYELKKKLQEQRYKLEKQLKEKEKAKFQEEMKGLEEKLEKRRSKKQIAKQDFNKNMEELTNTLVQELRSTIKDDRNKARAEVSQSKGWSDWAKNAVKEGAGVAYDVVAKGLEGVIGTIGS